MKTEEYFFKRVVSMIRLDFYRLIHTPLLYIMLFISAIIPSLILSTAGMATTTPEGVVTHSENIENAWQLIERSASVTTVDNIMDLSGYANINMVFIFAGLLMAIFVSHDYSSGFIKGIFTTHPNKIDYVISKSLIGIVSGVGMIAVYTLATLGTGMVLGKSFDVNINSLVLCILSKIIMMPTFCGFFLAISVFCKKSLWISIIGIFLFGMLLYPAASVATLDTNFVIFMISTLASVVGTFAISACSKFVLNNRDIL